MSTIRAVTVYCSSSSRVAQGFKDAARDLGAALASRGWKLVYGGNNVGCMGVLADAVRGAGGKVVGVTPQLFVDHGSADPGCDELVVTEGMRERKALMEQRGDAFVALPGGLGTFEEFFEIVCGKVLGYHDKAIVLLNVQGYYTPLLEMIEHGVEANFIKAAARDVYFVAASVAEAVDYLGHYVPPAASKQRSFETSRTSAAE